jgi:hypothetical protein
VVVCPAKLCYSLEKVSVPCHRDVVTHSCPSLFHGGCSGEWFRAKDNRYKMETENHAFLLSLVNSWAQIMSQCFFQ